MGNKGAAGTGFPIRRVAIAVAVLVLIAPGQASALSTPSNPAHLKLRSIRVTPSSAAIGSTVDVSVRVRNTGERSGSGRILFRQSGHRVSTAKGVTVGPGRARSVDVQLTVQGPADPNAAIIACLARPNHPRRCGPERVQTPFAVLTLPLLQTAITPDSPTPPLASDYQASATRNVGSLPVGNTGFVRVWIRNAGQADGSIGNDPVPITKSPSGAGAPQAVITGHGSDTTCNVPANNLNASSIDFDNLVIAGGSECSIKIGITPQAGGATSLSFSIQESVTNTSISDTIQATGLTPPHLTLSPTSLNFGNVLQGTSSASKRITVTNDGDQSALGLSIVTASTPSRFTSTNDCPANLAGGASCHVDTTFSPLAGDAGSTLTGSVTVNFAGGNNPSASLSGKAVATAANLTIDPTSFTSPADFAPNTQQSVPVTVTNNGEADSGPLSFVPSVNNANLTVTASFTPPLGSIQGCGTVLAGGQECVVYLGLRANANGASSWIATLQISATPGGSQTFTWSRP